ncbi:MAG: acetylxylan esterase [Spirochaetota bacterium]
MVIKHLIYCIAVPFLAFTQSIEMMSDHTNAVYTCGEVATFTIQVLDKDKNPLSSGRLNVSVNNFGPKVITNAVFDLAAGNPVTISGTLAEPGFLKCTASIKLDKDYRTVFGAAYEPEKLVAGSACPADFDEFWANAVKKLDTEVPIDARIERVEKWCNEKHEGYRVSFATFDGMRVYGFLSVPAGKGPFPVEVNVPGAGPGVIGPSTYMADNGFISLVMNVHPFEPADTADAQMMLYTNQDNRVKEEFGAPRYCVAGVAARETFFYYRIILGINRAVNWLASRPDVDRTRFCYGGTSQGGGFGLILCGLNRNFTKGSIHVAAIADLLGFQKGRDSGWPKLVENTRAEDKGSAISIAPYFDGVHFGSRIACPVRMSVGFSDETCPPAAVYAAYNALRVKDKAIEHGIAMPHRVYPQIYDKNDAKWLRVK